MTQFNQLQNIYALIEKLDDIDKTFVFQELVKHVSRQQIMNALNTKIESEINDIKVRTYIVDKGFISALSLINNKRMSNDLKEQLNHFVIAAINPENMCEHERTFISDTKKEN